MSYALKITEFADRKPDEHKTELLDDSETKLENVSADSNIDEIWPVYKVGIFEFFSLFYLNFDWINSIIQRKYKRKYEPDEDTERFEIFKKRIIEHCDKNENGEVFYTLKITEFFDRKPKEYKELSESQLENVTADSNVDELWIAYKVRNFFILDFFIESLNTTIMCNLGKV